MRLITTFLKENSTLQGWWLGTTMVVYLTVNRTVDVVTTFVGGGHFTALAPSPGADDASYGRGSYRGKIP